jgi:hypothetical protein
MLRPFLISIPADWTEEEEPGGGEFRMEGEKTLVVLED